MEQTEAAATSEVLVPAAAEVVPEASESITTSTSDEPDGQAETAAAHSDDASTSPSSSSTSGTKRSYEEIQQPSETAAHSGPPGTEGQYSGYGHSAASSSYTPSTSSYEDDSASSAKRTRTDYDASAYGSYDPAAYAQASAAQAYDYSAHQQQYHQQQMQQQQQVAVPEPAAPQEPLPDSLSPDPPSKVIHFRNEDMIEMATPFGPVEKVVMMATKNQALLEFRDLSSAILMSNFYINTQPLVRGRKVYMRFSRHQALNTSGSSVNRVLLITLSTETEPVIQITADIVWQIFSSYGFIERIVVINKTGLQALVQYQSPTSAQTALQYLNGKTVYVGTDPILPLTLYIQYSHLQQLTIKHNSASARDYTTPLPWGQQQPYGGGYGGGYPPQGGYGAPPPPPHYGGGGYGGAPGGYGGYGSEYSG